ncbi:MAG: PAS domain S-box protein [Methanotrichaceae archaeon]|jgi:PAS domain S-box-containing protein
MKKEKAESNHNDDLRRQAEERLKDCRNDLAGSTKDDSKDALALVHELQVHQIELEMQNEELKRAKLEAEEALAKYSALYDSGPIGLFAFDEQGLIQEVNLAGVALLGVERRNLMKRPFHRFVTPEDRPSFDEFCKAAFETSFKQTCEMNLLKEGKPTVYARIESIATEDSSPNGRQCRIAVIDITERKNAEEKLAQQSAVLKAEIESSKGPIFSVDHKYRYTSFNSRHAEVMKALFGADIEIGHSILDYHTNSDNRISAQMNIDRTLCGESLTLEACAGDRALSRRYFEISHNPVRDSYGKIIGVAVFARDLTEHKRTEKALLESEKKYRVLFNSAADAFVIHDLEGHFLEVNDEAVKRLGYSRDELLKLTLEGIDSPENARQVKGRIKEVLNKGFNIFESVQKTKDGRLLPAEVHARLVDHYEGKKAILAIWRDISDRKRAGEMRSLLASIVESSEDAIIGKTLDGTIVSWNAGASRIYGYSAKEAIGKSISILIPPDQFNEMPQILENIRRGEKVDRYETPRLRKDGHTICVSLIVSPIRNEFGEIVGASTVATDFTERKRIEKALRESEEKWRSLVSVLPDYISLLDLEGGFLFLNHYPKGFTKKEVIGSSVYQYLSTQSKEIFKKEIDECQNTGKLRKFEHTGKGNHGTMRVYETYLVPILEKNKVTGTLSISRDITDRKRDEEALKRYSENLKELVDERTKQLQQAARLATLGEMATMVSHDLRNPLQVIISMVYLAKELLISAKNPQVVGHITATEILDDIEKSCSYMNQIVSDLQSYAGPLNLELVETDIHQLINNALSFLEIPDGVKVSTEVENGLLEITVDPEKIKRVIVNLVNNSIQSMPKGGQITITVIRKGESVVLTIRDEGAGIPNENIPKLFLPLFTTKSKGIGLGLAICKRLVEAHRGSIVVTSKVDAGTEVTIEIPQDEKTWTRNLY